MNLKTNDFVLGVAVALVAFVIYLGLHWHTGFQMMGQVP
jgi:hypothetical protein